MISYSWYHGWYHWWYHRWRMLRRHWRWRFALSTPSSVSCRSVWGVYCSIVVPQASAFHLITSVLRKPLAEFILSCSDKGVNTYLVSNEMLETVWIRLLDSLSSLGSSLHRSLRWSLNMQPISTICMLAGTQGNFLLAIGFVSCSSTFLSCFATWLL